MAVIKSREIGEDEILERKVVAERRFGGACSELPSEGMETKSESTGNKKERDAKTMKGDVGCKE